MSDLRNWVCEHGSLRRKCEICERDERIKELESFLGGLVEWCHKHYTDLITVGLGEVERVLRGGGEDE